MKGAAAAAGGSGVGAAVVVMVDERKVRERRRVVMDHIVVSGWSDWRVWRCLFGVLPGKREALTLVLMSDECDDRMLR